MPIPIARIRSAARLTKAAQPGSVTQARVQGFKTAFLCHSHLDADLVEGVVSLLQSAGWRVYVDWADASMPETPSRETAERIKQKIVQFEFFLFLATSNSTVSRWCPWEIGYADSQKTIKKIMIIPTSDSSGKWYGNEYLQLYARIDEAAIGGLRVIEPGQTSGTSLSSL